MSERTRQAQHSESTGYHEGGRKRVGIEGENDWASFIAPDESYIIFSSQDRRDSLGKQDLYISFREDAGGWRSAVNMGSAINSTDDEICPSVSLDGRFLFFTSRRRGQADIFWTDSSVIRRLDPDGAE